MNKFTHPKLMRKVTSSWSRYGKNLGTMSVCDVIPAQLFLDAYMYGYRQGRKDQKRNIPPRH